MKLEKLAFNIVNKTMKIGQKPNPEFLKINKKHSWMKGSFTIDFASKKLKKSKKATEKFLKKYEDVDYGPLLIRKENKYKVKNKIGMVVKVLHHPDNKELAHLIRKECWKKGAFASLVESDMGVSRELYKLSPIDSLRELPKLTKLVTENIDATIQLEVRDWSEWSKGIPTSKLMASQQVSIKLHDISDKKKTPWVLVGWPHKKTAKENGFPYSKLEKIMFECIDYSFSKDIQELVKKYTKAFKGKKIIRIVSDDGTDLTFSLKGRHLNADTAFYDEKRIKAGDVGGNIPTGEIFFAPIENSANGTLTIPISVIPGEGVAEKLILTFKNGYIVKNTAKKGKGMLNKFIKNNGKDSNKIAEFGVGLNKKAKFTRGEIIIDEKIFGSIHIAIGWNKGYGGKTNAVSHLDFIKDLRNCNGKVYADNKLILNKGKLVTNLNKK